MRKRLLPGLLILALFLSIAPAAFSADSVSMTLVQQTTGEFADVNKEIIYGARRWLFAVSYSKWQRANFCARI